MAHPLSVTCVKRFARAASFNGRIGSWDTSLVGNMSNMFLSATSFAQSIEDFKTHSVYTMHSMFYEAKSFNGQVKHFDVSNASTNPIAATSSS